MKIIVIYNSQTGFTKRYAEWIAEATGADCLALSAAKAKNLADYDAIIFGGWACAGNIELGGIYIDALMQYQQNKLVQKQYR